MVIAKKGLNLLKINPFQVSSKIGKQQFIGVETSNKKFEFVGQT